MAQPVSGAVIPVVNAGFESPQLVLPATFAGDVESWDELEYHGYGVLFLSNATASPAPAPTTAGVQYAAVSNRAGTGAATRMTQQIYDGSSTGLVAGATYTLTASMIKAAGLSSDNLRFGLYQDAAMTVAYDDVDCTTIALTDTAWNDFSASFTASAGDAGKALYIGFEHGGPTTILTRWFVDNVRLTGDPIPEPASLALLGLGAALIGSRRR
ncbi:MAG: carbohydrate binding domain-containing protein [Phycisphaeraceae bacterium]|nr:carbohydrate binding domain-containing protein [Phycisphaeraceae bacterium]